MSSMQPVFRDLGKEEAKRLLARNHVGRIAFTFHDRVDIEPIHYVFDDGWIYGRTSQGAKLTTIAHHRWVAFEVDEVRGMFDWKSVVVKGAFYLLDDESPAGPDPAFSHGVELLRGLIPETLRVNDPASFRQSVFRIHCDEMSGREAAPG